MSLLASVAMSDAGRFAAAREIIRGGLVSRAYPAAAIEVGRRTGPIWREAFGRLDYDEKAPPTTNHTIFDLASLTKVIATTSIAMRLVAAGRLDLGASVGTWLPGWHEGRRGEVTVRHLFDHSSGLPAHARLWERATGRSAFEQAIATLPLERAPGATSVYSDVGFMLLGFVLEDIGGAPLDAQFAPLAAKLEASIGFRPPADWLPRIAPTEDDPWRGRVLRGEVHDENAFALGGIAAHAGLFGTAPAVGAFARLVLSAFDAPTWLGYPATMRLFAARTGVRDSSRAIGWDTMLPTSSCGTRMSTTAIGHTGYTGTSLWIDRERDIYVVWLTNRVHPTRTNEQLAALRSKVHDAVMAAM
jgi:serine-type D-Ala-D-Ala carboxypeptidase